MRKTNKLLSFLLTLCMMLSVALPLTANAAITFSDVPSTHTYYEAITNLAAEGILNGFEDGSFKPEDPVTRAQFTKIICYALGSGDLKYGAAQRVSFPDVDPNHWAIDNITTAYNSKIINGYDDGTFKPENSVLYEQAVKMAVCALGYPDERAQRSGGYPNGYIKIASDIKMLKDLVGVKTGEPLNRGSVAQLIDNMRDAEMYKEVTNPSRPGSSQQGGGNLRENNAGQVLQAEGRIVSVYGTSIYYGEEPECNRKQIELELANGDREFFGIEKLDISDTNAYLGRSVVVYYEHDNSADYDEATNIAFQKNKNDEITISLEDLEGMDGDDLEYYVEDEEEPVEISIDKNICIIHNGASIGDDFEDVIDEALVMSGHLTLVCSMDNDIADVAFIKTYETIVVGSKDTTNCKIFDYYNNSKSFVLDEDDRNKKITFTKDGKSSNFSGIAVNNIVSVSVSDDESLVDVQISTAKKTGTVTDIMANGKIKLDSDKKLYRFTDSCYKGEEISPGSYVTLYLDAFGNVARYIITAEKAFAYGYLTAAEDGTMTDPKVEVMVYTLSNSSSSAVSKQYALKDNVRIDGKVYSVSKNATEIMKHLERTAGKAGVNAPIQGTDPINATFSQPIRFTTSSSNVIDKILTSESTGEFNVSLNLKCHMDEPVECRADRTTLGEYSIENSVPIIVVPPDRMDDTYKTVSNSYFKKGESYYIQLINVSSANKPAAIYVYGTKSAGADATTEVLSEDNIPMIVTGVSTVTYMDSTRTCLKLLGTDGTAVEAYDDNRKDTEAIADVKVGDIIRVATDVDKMIDAIEVLVVAEDVAAGKAKGFVKFDGTNGEDELDAPFRAVLGVVRNAAYNTVNIAPSFNPTASDVTVENYNYTEKVKIYMIDTSKSNEAQRVTSDRSFGEIIGHQQQADNGSNLFVFTQEGEVMAMIIIK